MIEHGSERLSAVTVESYGLTIRDGDGFIGDRASSRGFDDILDRLRGLLDEAGTDPFGTVPARDLANADLDNVYRRGDAFAAGLIHSAVEEFAQTLAGIVRRYREEPSWAGVRRLAVGGGMRDSRIGEIAIGRTTAILQLDGIPLELVPIANNPDRAALIGAVQLVPAKSLKGARQMIAADIGGSSIRVGLVKLPRKRPVAMGKVRVVADEQWRHGDEDPKPSREDVVARLAAMIETMAGHAEPGTLCPVVVVACPGRIGPGGDISQGSQNLPGDWEDDDFNLPEALARKLPTIGGKASRFLMHNDAVVQGLSEVERMRGVERWGIVTIGTGLGNAVFANKA